MLAVPGAAYVIRSYISEHAPLERQMRYNTFTALAQVVGITAGGKFRFNSYSVIYSYCIKVRVAVNMLTSRWRILASLHSCYWFYF